MWIHDDFPNNVDYYVDDNDTHDGKYGDVVETRNDDDDDGSG